MSPFSSLLSAIPVPGDEVVDSTAVMNRRLAPVVVFVLIAFFYWPLLSRTYSIFDVGPDLTVMAVPDLELRAKALRAGVLPLWDPYLMGGKSPLGEVTPALLDPVSFPLLLMPLRNGHIPLQRIQVYYVLLHCLAGLAAYWLIADFLKPKSPLPAVMAGVFYAIGGVPANAVWFQVVTEAIYAPLVLLFLFRSLRGMRPLGNSAVAGLLLGLSWFSGSHHIPVIMSVACGFMLLIFAFLGNLWRGLLRLGVFAGIMLLVSAPQVIPALQWGQWSMRWVRLDRPVPGSAKVPFAAHLVENIHPSSLLNIVVPANDANWGNLLFAGIVAIVFAVLAFSRNGASRLKRLLLLVALAGVLMSVSAYNTWYGVLYWLVPMLDKLRESAFWVFLTHISLACLLGMGVEVFLGREEPNTEQRLAKVLAVSGALLVVIAYVVGLSGATQYAKAGDQVAISGLVALLLACLLRLAHGQQLKPSLAAVLALGLLMLEHGNVGGRLNFPRGHGAVSRYEKPMQETESIAQFLRSRPDLVRIDVDQKDVPVNFGDLHMIEELSSHGGSMLTSVFNINFWTPAARRLFGINYYVARKPSQPDQVDLFTAPSGIKVFRNPNARPRVWSVHHIASVRDYPQARQLLANPSFDMATTTFVNSPPPAVEDCGSQDQVDLLKRTWFSVVIRANMACKGMLILNDNWYPGWRTTVDGKKTPIYSAYMTIRGVVVESGTHMIEMHYRPRAFYLGLLMFAIGVSFTAWLYRRPESPDSDLLGY